MTTKLTAALLLLGRVLAWAGGTGGSMGGGSWSGGSPSRVSTGGGTASSSHYYPSSGGGSGGSTSAIDILIFVALALVAVGLVVVLSLVGARMEARRVARSLPSNEPIDVTVLRIAIDGRARKFVQTELARIAKLANTGTDRGRVTMLREVALLLRRLRDAWVYGGAVNEPMRKLGVQRRVFERWVDDARVRFREETIRNEQGVHTSTPASAYLPRTEQGAGLILVSLVIAARRELFTVRQIGTGEDLRLALENVGTLDVGILVAAEIVWQPSEDADRMSSLELEAKYPPPLIVPIAGALVGKVFCGYCAAPFPGELVSCPHCGGPNR